MLKISKPTFGHRSLVPLCFSLIFTIACADRGPGVEEPIMPGASSYDGDAGRERDESMADETDGDFEASSAEAPAEPPMDVDSIKSKLRDLPQSGQLTAGSFDDNLNFGSFRKLYNLPEAVTNRVVRVRDQYGRPVSGATVTLKQGQKDFTIKTGAKGNAVFLTGHDPAVSYSVVVTGSDDKKVVKSFSATDKEWVVVLDTNISKKISTLDLALVIDTTGSMSDELRYIQSELKTIVAKVDREFPGVIKRYALVVYRDSGDSYVTKSFDFTSDLDKFHQTLLGEDAGGGGDYPEAMHTAMEKAVDLSWSEEGSAKVMFLIADAPPHDDKIENTFAAVEDLRKNGVAIYPLGASGVGDLAEKVMRRIAVLTNTKYLFLTDDSGIGLSHAEPRIPCYQVHRLTDLLAMVINEELDMGSAKQKASVVRTVGNPVNGRCETDQQRPIAHNLPQGVVDLP